MHNVLIAKVLYSADSFCYVCGFHIGPGQVKQETKVSTIRAQAYELYLKRGIKANHRLHT